VARLFGFPDSDDPFMVTTHLDKPKTLFCSVDLFTSHGEQLLESLISVPSACQGKLAMLVLSTTFQEKGVQYDRVGSMWIGDIEVLRTTTAEPNKEGIVWKVEKDITIYSDYIQNTADLVATLYLPNIVTTLYNGVLYANVTLTFYVDENKEASNAPKVIPLTRNPGHFSDSPTNQEMVFNISGFSKKLSGLYIDIYASNHGCEEFYYSNAPDDISESLGACGGGVYREIQVYVDGYLGSATYHYPVIYSGGMNPLLWRPIAGVMQFDIPPHRLDLSCFYSLLSDGDIHTLKIVVNDDTQPLTHANWHITATLLVYEDLPASIYLNIDSSEFSASDDGIILDVKTTKHSSQGIEVSTTGSHSYSVTSTITLNNTEGSFMFKVAGNLNLRNVVQFIGDVTMNVNQRLTSTHTSTFVTADGSSYEVGVTNDWPLELLSTETEDTNSMSLNDAVDYSFNRVKSWAFNEEQGKLSSIFSIGLSDRMASKATYNRSQDHSTYYVMDSVSAVLFKAESSSSIGACYNRHTSAAEGFVEQDELLEDNCVFPPGMYFCGYDVCGWTGDSIALQHQIQTIPKNVPPAFSPSKFLQNLEDDKEWDQLKNKLKLDKPLKWKKDLKATLPVFPQRLSRSAYQKNMFFKEST